MTTQEETNFKIEPFDKSDTSYEAIVQIANTIYPQYPSAVMDLQRRDTNRLPQHYKHRVVLHWQNEIVAYGEVAHDPGAFHPQKFWVEVFVQPEFEDRGFGKALYTHLSDHLAQLNPISYDAAAIENHPRALRFLTDRGFELKMREYSSKLDLNSFEPAQFASYVDRCRAAGVEIVNYDELGERFPDDWGPRLYAAINEINNDVPWLDATTVLPYDAWIARWKGYPHRISEALLLALDGDDIVGVTMLSRSAATTDTLFTGLTGVKRSHRRKGIALALKCQSLSYAKANLRNSAGVAPDVMTENEANNPMYTINERMGFVRQPDMLMYRKEI